MPRNVIETVSAKHIENVIRLVGGLMYLAGAGIMAFNLWRTVKSPSIKSSAPTVAPNLIAAN